MEWSAVNSDAVGMPPAPDPVVPVPPPASAPEPAPSSLEAATFTPQNFFASAMAFFDHSPVCT